MHTTQPSIKQTRRKSRMSLGSWRGHSLVNRCQSLPRGEEEIIRDSEKEKGKRAKGKDPELCSVGPKMRLVARIDGIVE